MKSRIFVITLALLAIALTACSKPTPTQVPQNNLAPTIVYPEPATESYPSPEGVVTQASVLYPEPKSGDEVSWEQAVAMVLNGEVTQIVQSKSLQLTLSLRDGRSLIAKEAALDDIKMVIEKCGAVCKPLTLVNQ
jgi:hypothetical protein